jgi:putative ABC transport system permease protein
VVHTRLRVSASLAGVLVTTGLYSVTLFLMGGGNLSLASADSLGIIAAGVARHRFGLPASLTLLGTAVSGESLATLAVMGLLAGALTLALTVFLRTDLGLAMRAAGSNPQMARSVAVDVDHMIVLGLGLSNGVIALSGALFAQFQGFASIQMGIGAVVTGLATLMLGEALLGRRPLGRWVSGAMLGAVVFQLLVAGAIRAGLAPDALKLVTSLLVLLVLLLPRLLRPATWRRQHA